jgi:DNA (cytosine-5)-methyltransferase 1
MTKGSGTRSGLLWEVERLLNEVEDLPQVLLMENVPQVLSDENISDFHSWCDFLGNKGYKCYSQILNAKEYGVAQNRERCFMVSILGNYSYKFPQTIPLETTMKDYLEPEVDECYYINTEKAQKLIQDLVESGKLGDKNVSNTVRGAETQ